MAAEHDHGTDAGANPAGRGGILAARLLLAAALAVAVFIRIRLAAMPLERDEGEYAYLGQLMLGGVPPYQEAANMKWPGTPAAYAAIMAVFGQSTAAIRVGLILVNLATAGFLYSIARRCAGIPAACFATAAYLVLAIVPTVLGLAAHAAHFVLLPAMAAVWLVQVPATHRSLGRLLLAGAFAGIAAIMKQSGAAFFGLVAAWVALCTVRDRPGLRPAAARLGSVAAGFALPIALLFAGIAATGSFGRFWFWTWDYARAYAANTPLRMGVHNFVENVGGVVGSTPVLSFLALLGAAALLGRRRLAASRVFVAGFLACSILAICPGLYFSRNYLIQLGPAIALLAALGADAVRGLALTSPRLARLSWVSGLAVAIGLLQPLVRWGDMYFRQTPAVALRTVYGFNPFPEAEVIGRYLNAHCPENARIAIVGSEPEIYFYARRRGVTDYLYVYPMTESQPYAGRMRREFIAQIEQGHPEFVIFVNAVNSWYSYSLLGGEAPLVAWFQRYERENLTLVGLVEVRDDGSAVYRWSFDRSTVGWPGKVAMAVYRRVPASGTAGQPARTTITW